MKVAELQGSDLDAWAAKASRIDGKIRNTVNGPKSIESRFIRADNGQVFRPSYNWDEAGAIIKNLRIAVVPAGDHWSSYTQEPGADGGRHWAGETPLVAAMRAAVGSKFGDEVPGIPQNS